jgi:hypothetical protein
VVVPVAVIAVQTRKTPVLTIGEGVQEQRAVQVRVEVDKVASPNRMHRIVPRVLVEVRLVEVLWTATALRIDDVGVCNRTKRGSLGLQAARAISYCTGG